MMTLATASAAASFAGTRAEPDVEPPERTLRGSRRRFVGDLYSRMPRIASVATMLLTQIAATPMIEQQPELAEHRHLGEAQRGEGEDRVERHDEQRGAEVPRGLLDRVLRAVDDDLLLDARVHLDRVVDPDAEHHREAGDRHDRQRDARGSRRCRTPRSTPMSTMPSGSSRHRTLNSNSRITAMIAMAISARVSMPPVR